MVRSATCPAHLQQEDLVRTVESLVGSQQSCEPLPGKLPLFHISRVQSGQGGKDLTTVSVEYHRSVFPVSPVVGKMGQA